MNQPNAKDATPYFFLVTEQYVLGTPRGIPDSDRTIDILFHDLARNYELQTKLNLASAALIRPVWNPPIAHPMKGRQLIEHVAVYLAAFCDDPQQKEQRKDYLINNGLVRILATDDKLKQELMPKQ